MHRETLTGTVVPYCLFYPDTMLVPCSYHDTTVHDDNEETWIDLPCLAKYIICCSKCTDLILTSATLVFKDICIYFIIILNGVVKNLKVNVKNTSPADVGYMRQVAYLILIFTKLTSSFLHERLLK